MSSAGFMSGLRENRIDDDGYKRLCEALDVATELIKDDKQISRLLVACIFEVPWEIENTVDHYRNKDEDLGKMVSSMADTLRQKISELLWVGLEEYYENID